MNIFVLSRDPIEAAQMLCDKHVPKMVTETTQILCTVAHELHVEGIPYKATHKHHPCVKWVGSSQANWLWALTHGVALANEHTFRFGTSHASFDVLLWLHEYITPVIIENVTNVSRTPFAQAMPEQYRHDDPVIAYRRYYVGEKRRFAKWAHGRDAPSWWV